MSWSISVGWSIVLGGLICMFVFLCYFKKFVRSIYFYSRSLYEFYKYQNIKVKKCRKVIASIQSYTPVKENAIIITLGPKF